MTAVVKRLSVKNVACLTLENRMKSISMGTEGRVTVTATVPTAATIDDRYGKAKCCALQYKRVGL